MVELCGGAVMRFTPSLGDPPFHFGDPTRRELVKFRRPDLAVGIPWVEI
jgi:hypothetical protein